MSNKQLFWTTYATCLAEAVRTTPDDYPPGADPEAYAKKVADKFAAADFAEINHEGRGFRLTCKKLGINQTRKAIKAYLEA